MKRVLIVLFFVPFWLHSQPNCKVYEGDCKKACELAVKPGGGQGSRSSQDKFDRAIALCPDQIAYFYMEKAVPYLKRGDFIAWKKLIDKAVEIDPIGQLGYRGWCRFQFLRDYEGAIKDIELLDSIMVADIGYGQNGQYHLYTTLALCYKKLGEIDKAIDILEKHTGTTNYSPWAFEYLHLGVMYLEQKNFDKAQICFNKQLKVVDLAETNYYLAKTIKELGNSNYIEHLKIAEIHYVSGRKLHDVYTTNVDKIYLKDIQQMMREENQD
ncbi:MAG: tetratricopeptide repeat protein [Ekhidna sp.]